MIERKITLESGANSHGLRLNIKDGESGLSFAEFRLTPEQLWAMLRGGSVELVAEGTEHLDRFGKTMVHDSFLVPKEVVPLVYGDAALRSGENWARAKHPDWDSYSTRRNNSGGIVVTVRKWVEAGETFLDEIFSGPHRDGGYFARKGSDVAFGPDREAARTALAELLADQS